MCGVDITVKMSLAHDYILFHINMHFGPFHTAYTSLLS